MKTIFESLGKFNSHRNKSRTITAYVKYKRTEQYLIKVLLACLIYLDKVAWPIKIQGSQAYLCVSQKFLLFDFYPKDLTTTNRVTNNFTNSLKRLQF